MNTYHVVHDQVRFNWQNPDIWKVTAMLKDYQFCAPDAEVAAIPNGDSFSVLVDGKIACAMATSGAHRFPTVLQAEVFGRQLARGYTSGVFLSADVSNYVIEAY
jgi:hypothetical protein